MKISCVDGHNCPKYRKIDKVNKYNKNSLSETKFNNASNQTSFKGYSANEKLRLGCGCLGLLAGITTCATVIIGCCYLEFQLLKSLLTSDNSSNNTTYCQHHSKENNKEQISNSTKECQLQEFYQQKSHPHSEEKNVKVQATKNKKEVNENKSPQKANNVEKQEKEDKDDKEGFSIWHILLAIPIGIIAIIFASEAGNSIPRSLE